MQPKKLNRSLQEFIYQAIGLFKESPLLVYDLTPNEIVLVAKAKAEETKEKFKQNLTIAYYGEIFARSKKLPKLQKILSSIDKPLKQPLSKGDIILLEMQKWGLNK